MPAMQVESFVFDARPQYPFLIPVKRYWNIELSSLDDDASTLILAHATSFVNEQWEPVLDDLYGLMATTSSLAGRIPKIREAWAIGCPNHGDAAIWNEEVLADGYFAFSWDEYARAIHLVLAGLGKGVNVDFSKRNLVAIGHSMGAIALVLTRTHFPQIRWSGAILLEPMLVPRAIHERVNGFLTLSAPKRRDVWPSRDAARKQFLEKSFKTWDPRQVDIYVREALRNLPTTLYPDKTGVTLKTTKHAEEATYKDGFGRLRGQAYLSTFCTDVPTHVVFGAITDILPTSNQDYIVKDLAQGKFQSVSHVESAGHVIVQQSPEGVAERLYEILFQISEPLKGKL